MTKLFIGASVLAVCSLASAAPMCVSGPLSNFLSLNAEGCMLGSSTVSSFTIAPPINLIADADAINPANVSVTVFASDTNPGLSFTTTASVGPREIAQLLLGYRIFGASFTGDSLTLVPGTVARNAAITAIQNYCLGGAFVPDPPNFPGTCPGDSGTLLVLNSGMDSVTFDPVSIIGILHDLTLDGGNNGSAAGATVSDRFIAAASPAEIPEPSTSLFLASGLIAAGFVRHFEKKRKR